MDNPRRALRKSRTARGSAEAATGFSIIQLPRSRRTVMDPSVRRTTNFSISPAIRSVSRESRKLSVGASARSTMVSGTRRTEESPPIRANISPGRALFAPRSRRIARGPRKSRRRRGESNPVSPPTDSMSSCSSRTRRKRTARRRRSTTSGSARSAKGETSHQVPLVRLRETISAPRVISIPLISSELKATA